MSLVRCLLGNKFFSSLLSFPTSSLTWFLFPCLLPSILLYILPCHLFSSLFFSSSFLPSSSFTSPLSFPASLHPSHSFHIHLSSFLSYLHLTFLYLLSLFTSSLLLLPSLPLYTPPFFLFCPSIPPSICFLPSFFTSSIHLYTTSHLILFPIPPISLLSFSTSTPLLFFTCFPFLLPTTFTSSLLAHLLSCSSTPSLFSSSSLLYIFGKL